MQTPQGWAVKLDGTTSSADAWGEMAVVLRSCLSSLPGVLAGAQANATDAAAATVSGGCREQGPHASCCSKQRRALSWACMCSCSQSLRHHRAFIACMWGLQAAVFTRPGEDRPLAVPGAAAPTKLRLDVGWALWKKAADAEETSVEFTIGCYDLQVCMQSASCRAHAVREERQPWGGCARTLRRAPITGVHVFNRVQTLCTTG